MFTKVFKAAIVTNLLVTTFCISSYASNKNYKDVRKTCTPIVSNSTIGEVTINVIYDPKYEDSTATIKMQYEGKSYFEARSGNLYSAKLNLNTGEYSAGFPKSEDGIQSSEISCQSYFAGGENAPDILFCGDKNFLANGKSVVEAVCR